jgi:hypothetical protein
VPIEQDLKILDDKSINVIPLVPKFPTYLKVSLVEMPTPLFFNLRFAFETEKLSIGATNNIFLSGISKRPCDNNY